MNQNYRKSLLLVFGIATGVVLLTATQRLMVYLTQAAQPESKFGNITADATLWYLFACAVFIIYRIVLRLPYKSRNGFILFSLHLIAAIVIALLHIAVQSTVLSFLKGGTLMEWVQEAFVIRIFTRVALYFMVTIACYAYVAYKRSKQEELSVYRLESQLSRAQFQMLKSQLNPDFLFQILRSISDLTTQDTEKADLLTARLGDFLRLSLEYGYSENVSLQQEMQLIRSYLDIRQIVNQSLECEIRLDPQAASFPIPGRALFSVVERIPFQDRLQIRTKLQENRAVVTISGDQKTLPELTSEEFPDEVNIQIKDATMVFILKPGEADSAIVEREFVEAEESRIEFQNKIAVQEKVVRISQPSSIRRFWSIFLIWTLIGLVYFARDIVWRWYYGEPLQILTSLKDQAMWYWWALVTPFIFWTTKRYPLESSNLRKNVLIHVSLSIFVSVLMVFLYIGQRWAFGLPLMATEILMSYPYAFDAIVYWAIIMVGEGLSFHRKYLQGELRSARLKVDLMDAQLQALKMQLHPHFLFNVLNSISELMHEDAAAARTMLQRLEKFLRLTFENAGLQEITLESELEFLQNYLEIEQVRFQNRLKVELNIDPKAKKDSVPNLILQPIVENAIRHGIAARSDAGKIRICATHGSGVLQLQVEDDGPGLRDTGYREGLGIANTKLRLEQLYGKESRLRMTNHPSGGLMVTLQIPLPSGTQREAL